MELSFEQLDGGITLAKLSGRLDLAGARSIDLPFTAHVATKSVRVVVDLSQVSFLASLGIRTLVVPAKAARARGGDLVLLNPQPKVMEVLMVSGLTAVLKVYTSLDEAVAGLGGAAAS
jgi:anti-anti-sigma factor